MYTVYCATCTITSKSYVGVTADFDYRKSKHIKDARGQYAGRIYAFQSALYKYGHDSFIWQVLETHDAAEDAYNAEEFFIAYLNTLTPNGYNIKRGGFNNSPTRATRQKISATLKKTSWFIGRSGAAHPNFGRVISDRERKNLSKKFEGENGPNAKLDAKTVRAIYQEYLNDTSVYAPQLAKQYGVSNNTIRNILKKRTWKSITHDLPDIDLQDRTKGECWKRFKGYVT